jgi:hypothetical protein
MARVLTTLLDVAGGGVDHLLNVAGDRVDHLLLGRRAHLLGYDLLGLVAVLLGLLGALLLGHVGAGHPGARATGHPQASLHRAVAGLQQVSVNRC